MPPLPRVLQVPAAAAALGLLYSAGWERTAFTLRRVEVPVLEPGTPPLRLLHLSDAHIRPGQRRKREWIGDLARLLPDLVVLTGDSLGGAGGVATMLAALAPLLPVPGVFVYGSNDYYAPRPKNPLKYFLPQHKRVVGDPLPWRDLGAGLTAAGWQDLSNRKLTLTLSGRAVELRGVDDPHLKRDRGEQVRGRVPAGVLALALVHAPEPRVLDEFSADGVALMLAGHTHGGQLRVPGIGALVTNCGLDRARCRGLSRYRQSWLHVSAGLGTSVYAPVRFACRPEATLLTLTAAPVG